MKDKDKNKIKSNIENATGKIKEKAGILTDDSELELEGKLDQLKVDTKKKAEDMKESGKETLKGVKQSVAKRSNELIDKLKKNK